MLPWSQFCMHNVTQMIITFRFLSFHIIAAIKTFDATAIKQSEKQRILSILISNFENIDISLKQPGYFLFLSSGICSRFKESIIRDSCDSCLTQKWRFCCYDFAVAIFLFPLQDIYFLPRVPTKTDRKCRCPYRLRHRSWLLRARGIFLSARM